VNEEFYVSIIGEIFDGYSEILFKETPIFVKHVSIQDQRYLHKYYEKYKDTALKRGVDSEEDVLKRLSKDEMWSSGDESKIGSLALEIKNLKQTQKKLFVPSQKESFQRDINEKESEILKLQEKRKNLVGKTAEDYASSRASQEMIRYFIFDGPDLKNNYFSEEEFDEIDDIELLIINAEQNKIAERISESNIQNAVLRPFFSMYMSQCENVYGFYGKPITKLSVHQLKVAVFGRMFFNIFQHTEDIPDNIKEDPEKLLAFSEAQRNKDSNSKFIKEDSDASAVFGATKEDMNIIAPETQKGGVSLSDALKKKGGKLSMEDMIKLSHG
jgi:ASC-1-like (ASCH) protein